MDNEKNPNPGELLRHLPPVEAVLQSGTATALLPETGPTHLTELARRAIERLRAEILKGQAENLTRADLLKKAEGQLEHLWRRERKKSLRRVINATGVIIHTNLGRAPLSESARQALVDRAAGYCSLEYDLETGQRGRRGGRAENLLAELTGAGDALIVNNCAAAAILVLTALGRGGEAIVSRGELVEIGGDFRVPDVMEQSGAVLREVGTTNRTKIRDYEQAITPETRLLVKVHPSNYRIVGFTATPTVAELAELAHRRDVLFYEDAGSGALFDLSDYGLRDEPLIGRSVAEGADVITFSGDKLLGGAQAGLIVGRSEVIGRLRAHPLYRALRASKLIYAVLETTLEEFRRGTHLENIPVLKMLAMTSAELARRTGEFADRLREKLPENSDLQFEVIDGSSVIGGGSAPLVQPPTHLLSIRHRRLPVNELEKNLRLADPPVAARILDDRLLLDLRTVAESEETLIIYHLSLII